jgi:esterase
MLAASAMTRQPANSGKLALYSTQMGTGGPRIAFCHGLFGQGKNWTTVAKALSADFRITLIDLPNHGRSGWTADFSYPEIAAAVGDLLRTQSEDGEPVAVVGHSMGGKVAMMLALQRPQLVWRLGVVDVSPVRYPGPSNFSDYVRGMRALNLSRLTDRAAADRALQPLVPDPTVRGFLLQNLRRDGHGWRWQMNLDLLGDRLPEIADWPDVALDPYPGPVLWVAGSESDYILPTYAQRMRELFPKVQQLTVKGAGHWVHSERPDVFVGAFRRFLS